MINWGTGITIAIVAFMAFILSMVFKANSRETDLFAPNYYEQELAFQQKIDARSNSLKFKEAITLEYLDNKIALTFPKVVGMEYAGKMKWYRPNDAKLDKTIAIELDKDNRQYVAYNNLVKGNYELVITWQFEDKNYQVKKDVYVK